MTDVVGEFEAASAPALALSPPRKFAHKLARALVWDAPPDYEEVMAQVRPFPGWGVLLVAGAAASWAGIIFGVVLLLR
jgi:hypothetical protein